MRPENSAFDRQTKAEHGSNDAATAKRCLATTRSGEPCKAHPLAGSDLCSLHTPGLASAIGRRGGLNRRRTPKPTPRPRQTFEEVAAARGGPLPAIESAPAGDAAPPRNPDENPMTAREVRIYMEKLTRLVAGGRLDPALARAATTAAATWLRAIAMDEQHAAIEKRLAALEAAAGKPK